MLDPRPLTDEEHAFVVAERVRQGYPPELTDTGAERVAAVMRPGLDVDEKAT